MNAFTSATAFAGAAPVAAGPARVALPPLRPHQYLRLCRKAVGLSVGTVADRLADQLRRRGQIVSPADHAQIADLVRLLERPGVRLRSPETLAALRRVFRFDPFVYAQLAGVPETHPTVCRGCGASRFDMRDEGDAGRANGWATPSLCLHCADRG